MIVKIASQIPKDVDKYGGVTLFLSRNKYFCIAFRIRH